VFVSFKYKIMIAFLAIELFFLSFIIIFNYYSVQNSTYKMLDKQINSNIVLFQELVKTPMMVYDLATLDNMTQRFGKLPNIDIIILKDSKKRILSKFKDHNGKRDHDMEHIPAEHKEIEFTIEDDGTILGYGYVIFDTEDVMNKIKENTQNIILIAIIEIILSVIASYLIGSILTKNLNILSNGIKKVSTDDKEIVNLNIHSDDEFEDISKSFYKMQYKIKDEIQKNKEKDNQIAIQSRSAAMGDMMGAIIHQWKQPLSIISTVNGSIELSLMLGQNISDDKLRDNAKRISAQINNMNTTMDDFRNFFKPQKLIEFNINDSVNDVKKLIGKIFSNKNIDIKIDLEDNINISGYPNELNQVIINILNNARDIIEEKDCEIKDIFIKTFIENDKAVITITDCASGVPENIIDKIFDPYVTTKSDDKGTGIGLDMSKTIIAKVDGDLSVKNVISIVNDKEYKGAQFRIELPLY